MATISLCMIVKNEERVLGRCLSSVEGLVDEIIIVDTGSTDHTKQIAEKAGSRCFDFEWIDDFSAARNYSFSKAVMDYCLWLDADDIIEEKDREGFLALKQSLTLDTDIVMMRYHTAFDEEGNPTFWYYRERLLRNNGGYVWQGAVHEAITPSGNILYSDVAVSHKKILAGDPGRNLNIYRKMLSEGKALNTREQYYYARELYYHKLYEEALGAFRKFLSLPDGWLENKIEACILASKCCRETEGRPASLGALLKSLEYDAPRAEICCGIGNYFMEGGQYEAAIFWYEAALRCKMDFKKGGFILPDCYHYIPALQLCVCYDKLGKYKEAMEYNEKAGLVKPNSAAVLYNKKYFADRESLSGI